MKRRVVGILAHVDSGKTTLSEALLYTSGKTKRLGRVDHGDAYLDTNQIERQRGITIFSKQAIIATDDCEFTLLDTPGHIDFSAEMERTLQVLDCAILVISGTDGVQSHTETLWRLLKQHKIPTFIFINKMDLSTKEHASIMEELTLRFGDGCIDFTDTNSDSFAEAVAMCDEKLMEEYINSNSVNDDSVKIAIANRHIFPCCFGSALKLDGVSEFLSVLNKYGVDTDYGTEFGARVFKISKDERGNRLTFMKVTGGKLCVKSTVGDEKINELRIYSGERYDSVPEAVSGMVCAATGLTKTVVGMGLGCEPDSDALTLEPIFTYCVKLPQGTDTHTAITKLRQLEEEETQLHIIWNEQLREIRIQVMGEVQLEVLKSIISSRFNMDVEFEKGNIIYKETITSKIEGVGHYEPLRHYAEVHLLLEPGKSGSGLKFFSKCSEDELDRNWQRLIMTHLEEKTHLGVLTGSPITDMKITLISGRAHLRHTEGGDFRQATYRAVRQGLMRAESVLLEPWYDFSLTLPTSLVGRAMTDINQMGGNFSPPETLGDTSVIKGSAPAAQMSSYQMELTAYSHGNGRLSCSFKGYEPCRNAEEIIDKIGYIAEADTDNTPNSVFCSHGAGFNVKWDEVFDYMHLPAMKTEEEITPPPSPNASKSTRSGFTSDEELLKIFEQTYGKVIHRNYNAMRTPKAEEYKYRAPKSKAKLGSYVLIDGYNIIFAWDDLKAAAEIDLDFARTRLIDRVCAYKAMRSCEVIVVFDAYKVKGNHGSVENVNNISVVYTKEAETADSYIERVSHELGKNYDVRVATSDYMEQIIILGGGALRISAKEFEEEVKLAEDEIRGFLQS